MQVYISYRFEDSFSASERVFVHCVDLLGKGNVFRTAHNADHYSIIKREQVSSVLSGCQLMIILIGPNWAYGKDDSRPLLRADDVVRIEVECATDLKLPVVVLRLKGAKLPPKELLPASLHMLYRAPQFDADSDSLESTLRRILPSAPWTKFTKFIKRLFNWIPRF